MSGRMHGRAHEIHILRNGRVHKIKRGHPSTRVDEYPLPVTFRNNVTGIFNLQVFSNFFIYFYMSRFTCKKNAYCTIKQYSTTIPVVFSFLMAFLVISKIVSWSKTYDLFFIHRCNNPMTTTNTSTYIAHRTSDLIFPQSKSHYAL